MLFSAVKWLNCNNEDCFWLLRLDLLCKSIKNLFNSVGDCFGEHPWKIKYASFLFINSVPLINSPIWKENIRMY